MVSSGKWGVTFRNSPQSSQVFISRLQESSGCSVSSGVSLRRSVCTQLSVLMSGRRRHTDATIGQCLKEKIRHNLLSCRAVASSICLHESHWSNTLECCQGNQYLHKSLYLSLHIYTNLYISHQQCLRHSQHQTTKKLLVGSWINLKRCIKRQVGSLRLWDTRKRWTNNQEKSCFGVATDTGLTLSNNVRERERQPFYHTVQ